MCNICEHLCVLCERGLKKGTLNYPGIWIVHILIKWEAPVLRMFVGTVSHMIYKCVCTHLRGRGRAS